MNLRKIEQQLKFELIDKKQEFREDNIRKKKLIIKEYRFWRLLKNSYPLDVGNEDKQFILLSKPNPTNKKQIDFWLDLIRDEFGSIQKQYNKLFTFISNQDIGRPFFYLVL